MDIFSSNPILVKAGSANNRNHDTRFIDMILLCSFNGTPSQNNESFIVRRVAAWLLERYAKLVLRPHFLIGKGAKLRTHLSPER